MRYELSDYEWAIIKPMLPNKPRGAVCVDDRRVPNGIFGCAPMSPALVAAVIPGRAKCELWCAIAHLRISRFRVRCFRIAPE
jgi:transposase